MEKDLSKLLDSTDDKILKILRDDGRIPIKEIGKKVHLTGQAVKNRLDKLSDLGIVQKYTVTVNCPVYGYRIHALITLHTKGTSKVSFDKSIQKSNFHIERCYKITGNQAYFMDSYFKDDKELQQFLKKLEKIGSYEVQIVLQEILPVSLE